jgi:molybdate transport system regulatory protein
MPKKHIDRKSANWVQGEIRLAGALDTRMISLLRAIDECGSINQAAKQVDLSYKGAWQMIERANNHSPKILVSTATGGSKGGGTSLTAAGRALLDLFTRLEARHKEFLAELNSNLQADTDMLLLLKPLTIKTSVANQLFATVTAINSGSVYAEVSVKLKGGELISVSLSMAELEALNIEIGRDILLLINTVDISIVTDTEGCRLSAHNNLPGAIIRVQQDAVECEVVIRLPGNDTLVATLTQLSMEALDLKPGLACNAVFNSNAVILAALV